MREERIREEAGRALKSGDRERLETLRFALAQIHNAAIQKRSTGRGETLTDEETEEVLRREVKRRKEAIELFRKGGRNDLAEKEERSLGFLRNYLPPPVGEDEIRKAVDALMARGLADFNSLMREAMKELKGKADGELVARIVKEKAP